MTVEKEKLLKETYDKFIQISISDFQMEGMEKFIDQDIMGYGTTVDEKVLTITDYRKLVIRQREQGKGIKMTFETTPVIHRMASDGNSAFFVDEIVLSIHIENNPIEMFLRISTILEYREEKWIVIHWHGSKPEYEEGETDTWHINEWKNKTEELERLVEEKTTDLESKNRELEIEASLGRVRAVAMNMLKTDELMNVAIILHKEIKLLGFTDVRNTIINIFNDKKEKFLNYDYSDYGISGINEVSYNSHPLNKEFVDKMRKVDKAFMMTELTGNDLDEWRKWRISEGQMPDSKLDQVNSIYYYEYSIDKGSIGISTFEPITEEQLEILQKFRNVFNLAYQHFSDLQKAEEQAREAQIEVALERVRAIVLSMKETFDMIEM
ncbi:MAG: nuclear transport factor 2 family protein, partial [Melioribacteraceae bacterium]|nr:nuclear transport factor 2 family protein [Melioribacteraceae bacterium]